MSEDFPKRAHSIEICAHADTKEDLIAVLNDIVWRLRKGATQSVCAGATAGSNFEYKFNPEMTHDAYMEAIDNIAQNDTLMKAVGDEMEKV